MIIILQSKSHIKTAGLLLFFYLFSAAAKLTFFNNYLVTFYLKNPSPK